MEPLKGASALVLHMNSTVRGVSMAAEGDHIANGDRAERAVDIAKKFFAPEAGVST